MAKQKIQVDGIEVRVKKIDNKDYISLTDIAKKSSDEPRFLIRSWLSNSGTLEYLYEWESKYNTNTTREHLITVLGIAAQRTFMMTPKKWIEMAGAIGIVSTSGRYGGTYAHSDIALNFCYWVSPKFQIYFIEEFQRLKADEQLQLGDPYNIKRHLTAGNYSLLVSAILSQTDERLLTHPQPYKSRLPIASESDMLNKIVFGNTAKEWRLQNTDKPADRNQRDYASILDLTILNNLEYLDSTLIRWGVEKEERKDILQEAYEIQYPILKRSITMERLQEIVDRNQGE